jgi:serine/threonine protein kinase/tetratricopeptide (TPR) repeat protein
MGRLEDDSYFEAVRAALDPRYRIEREVGHGAYATVFLASSPTHPGQLAIKVLKPEWGQAVTRERFLREIKVSAELRHENILPLLDSGDMGGFLFFVMPYVAGETLRQKLRREQQLKVDEILRITRGVAAGLAEAHARGVLHRDVKPENILLDHDRALVADFGIAKAFTDAGVDTITSTGLGVGTPTYMSPEQASGDRLLDQRSDVYSLTCVVFEMLAGETPYTGPTAQSVIAKKLSLPIPSASMLRETLSPQVDAVLRRGLAKAPADRYATVEAFIAALAPALEAAAAARTPSLSGRISHTLRARPIATAVTVATALAAGLWAINTSRSAGADWVGGRPQSVVVIPLHSSTSSAQERALSATLADAITRELNRWESIRAVPGVSLAGPMFDLGFEGSTLGTESDGIRVARQVRVQGMLAVLVRVDGDSAHAEANLIDVARGRPANRPVLASAVLTDLASLVRPIVSDVLGLGSEGADPASLRRVSAFPDAVVANLEGVQFLDRGRLSEAEQSFRRALAIDSSFALAKHHLAISLYLGAGTVRRLTMLAPDIARLSTAAAADVEGLGRRDSLRIAAFHAFQAGDYQAARGAYATLLAEDPTDVYALLMRGAVELRDPWLVAQPDSTYQPRGNPNIAIRDLNEILRLRPMFDLGYDHLSELYRLVNSAAERSACPGFEVPQNQVRLPWESGRPEQQRYYCPVIVGDSVAWMSRTQFDAFDKARARTGASRFFERYIALIRRWATYAENEARPREEMVTALLAQRQRLGIAEPERIAAITDTALRFAESAMALKSDTTSDDLARLGVLYLAVGDHARSLRLTEHVLRDLPREGAAPRLLAANPFLATGQPSRAMAIRSAVPVQRFIPDPSTGTLIPFGGAELALARIQILGATGIGGAPLHRELRDVYRLWSESRYDDGQRRALRGAVTLDLAPALMLDSTVLTSWDRSVAINDPLWRALIESGRDTARARSLLRSAIDSTTGNLSESTRTYLQGVIALRLGDYRLAITRFSRLDSIPLRMDVLDVGWGLRSLSMLRRGEAHEALGETENARLHYAGFTNLWATPDSLGRLLVQDAARRAGRLKKSP